ncbi:MAG: hypothetical protein K5644_00325 [Lachnospiraceae bacterium]|nr:hypothetical protein [Lachnospiraceae bacterium]
MKVEKGKVTDITNHPDVEDKNPNNNPNKVAVEKIPKPTEPTPTESTKTEDNEHKHIIDVDEDDKEEGCTYWFEMDDITEDLTEDDLELINKDRQFIIYMLRDDDDFIEPSIIIPEYDELTNRITFKTDTIKPFILAYTDGEDWSVFEEDDEDVAEANADKYADYQQDNDVTSLVKSTLNGDNTVPKSTDEANTAEPNSQNDILTTNPDSSVTQELF